MNRQAKDWLILLGMGAALFYLIPAIALLLASEVSMGLTVALLLLINPLFFLAIAIIYSLLRGFRWLLPLALTALFAPSIFLFYNESAAVYILLYGGLALIGSLAGPVFRGRR